MDSLEPCEGHDEQGCGISKTLQRTDERFWKSSHSSKKSIEVSRELHWSASRMWMASRALHSATRMDDLLSSQGCRGQGQVKVS